ncbi:unnamed protein product [Amoebophrya sp. A120]|nr:unnamed protein product [Amoebophrya sp. A120]|eukprot:GSA120T00008448001.1
MRMRMEYKLRSSKKRRPPKISAISDVHVQHQLWSCNSNSTAAMVILPDLPHTIVIAISDVHIQHQLWSCNSNSISISTTTTPVL